MNHSQQRNKQKNRIAQYHLSNLERKRKEKRRSHKSEKRSRPPSKMKVILNKYIKKRMITLTCHLAPRNSKKSGLLLIPIFPLSKTPNCPMTTSD